MHSRMQADYGVVQMSLAVFDDHLHGFELAGEELHLHWREAVGLGCWRLPCMKNPTEIVMQKLVPVPFFAL